MKAEDVVSNTQVYVFNNAIKVSKYPMSVNIAECNAEITEGVAGEGNE